MEGSKWAVRKVEEIQRRIEQANEEITTLSKKHSLSEMLDIVYRRREVITKQIELYLLNNELITSDLISKCLEQLEIIDSQLLQLRNKITEEL